MTGGKWKPPEHFKTKYKYSKKQKQNPSGQVLFLLQQNATKLRLGSSLLLHLPPLPSLSPPQRAYTQTPTL